MIRIKNFTVAIVLVTLFAVTSLVSAQTISLREAMDVQQAETPARTNFLRQFPMDQYMAEAKLREAETPNAFRRLENATMRIVPGCLPLEFCKQDLVQFEAADTLPMGWILMAQSRGREFAITFVALPLGLGRGERMLLPVDGTGEGSGQILVLYMPVALPVAGAPNVRAGVLRLAVNYPLWDRQPASTSIIILERKEVAYNDGMRDITGLQFTIVAEGFVQLFVNGTNPTLLFSRWGDITGEQMLFLPYESIRSSDREVAISMVDDAGNVLNEPAAPRTAHPYPNFYFRTRPVQTLEGWTRVEYPD